MNFNEYQEKARSTAIYPAQMQVIYPSLGVCGEAGEIAELVKKWIRDESGHNMTAEHRDNLTKEIGDVLWYLANLCSDLGINLSDVAIVNLDKLASRQSRGKLHGDGSNR